MNKLTIIAEGRFTENQISRVFEANLPYANEVTVYKNPNKASLANVLSQPYPWPTEEYIDEED